MRLPDFTAFNSPWMNYILVPAIIALGIELQNWKGVRLANTGGTLEKLCVLPKSAYTHMHVADQEADGVQRQLLSMNLMELSLEVFEFMFCNKITCASLILMHLGYFLAAIFGIINIWYNIFHTNWSYISKIKCYVIYLFCSHLYALIWIWIVYSYALSLYNWLRCKEVSCMN